MSLFIKIQGQQLDAAGTAFPFELLEDELSEALSLYWSTAEEILQKSGVKLFPPAADYFELGKNFFQFFFFTHTTG